MRCKSRRLPPCRATRPQREGQVGMGDRSHEEGTGVPVSWALIEAFFQLPLL
jgi:hypothetical protein